MLLLLVDSEVRSQSGVDIFDSHDCFLKTLIKELVNFQTRELVINITEVTITVVEFHLDVLNDNIFFLVICLPRFFSVLCLH